QERCQSGGAEGARGTGQGHARGGPGDDGMLAGQLQQVVGGLEQRRAAASSDAGLRALDHAEKERWEDKRRDEMREDADGHHRKPPRATKSATITVTRM